MRKILVLGGNGFLGKNLCNYLADMGEKVYSFDMWLPKERNPKVEYLSGDFFDDYTLEKVVKGMDVIYHAICTLNPGNSNEKCIVGYERDFVQTAKLCYYINERYACIQRLSSAVTTKQNHYKEPRVT